MPEHYLPTYTEALSGDLSKPKSIALLSNHGDIVMRILSKLQVKELVLYSPQHIARLEKAGQFPKRVPLGPNRVGWVESEVLDWLNERLKQREDPKRHS